MIITNQEVAQRMSISSCKTHTYIHDKQTNNNNNNDNNHDNNDNNNDNNTNNDNNNDNNTTVSFQNFMLVFAA